MRWNSGRGDQRRGGAFAVDRQRQRGVLAVPAAGVLHHGLVCGELELTERDRDRLGVARRKEALAVRVLELPIYPAKEAESARPQRRVVTILVRVPRVQLRIEQMEEPAKEVLFTAMRGRGEQEQVKRTAGQLLGRDKPRVTLVRGWVVIALVAQARGRPISGALAQDRPDPAWDGPRSGRRSSPRC